MTVGGGESGWATPDTVDGNLVWSSGSGSGTIGGIVTRYDRRTKLTQNVEVWPMSTDRVGGGESQVSLRVDDAAHALARTTTTCCTSAASTCT